jgi:hypothetical protein
VKAERGKLKGKAESEKVKAKKSKEEQSFEMISPIQIEPTNN